MYGLTKANKSYTFYHDETNNTPLSALPQFVDDATKRLFAAFEGATVPHRTIEDFVRRLFERKL
jgi:hypothetical protein